MNFDFTDWEDTTKLKDWWKMVKTLFEQISSESNELFFTALSDDADIDNLSDGYYEFTSGLTNNPVGSQGLLIQKRAYTSSVLIQFAIGTADRWTRAIVYTRVNHSGTWEAWEYINQTAIDELQSAIDALEDGTGFADGAITESAIKDGAVTNAKLADRAVTADKLHEDSVTTSKIANGAVTSSCIANNTIIADDISDRAIETDKIADGAVTEEKIADGAVTADKLSEALNTELDERLTLSVVDALPSTSVTYDFEDGASLFTTPMIGTSSKGTSSVEADETTGNQYQSIKVSDSATIGSSSNVLSKLDFTSTSENATDLTVEFDFQYVDNGRMRIALCDLDVQDAKTGNIRYDYDGFAADIWSSSNNQFLINSSGSKHETFFGVWLHARFDIDFSTSKVRYKIVSNDDSSDYINGTVDFHGECTKVTGIIVYTWNAGDEVYIDNIEITARTDAKENVLYGIENGDGLDTYTYVDGKALEIGAVADGAVTVDKLADGLKAYSTTPQKTGYWTDGTPIWRQAFSHTFTDDEKTDIASNAAWPFSLPVTDNNSVFIINGYISLMETYPCVIDDSSALSWENGRVKFTDGQVENIGTGYFDGIYGWFEFVTAESNISA